MKRYLNPKTDMVFKKIFGQHPNILKSFLNAILPLSEGRIITDLEYLPAEQVPEIPDFKNTITDVKCTDDKGHVFIVEMQVRWTASFSKRLLFGTSRAYVHQLGKGCSYGDLKHVIGIGLIDAIFEEDSNEWYHYYQLRHHTEPEKTLDEIQLLFIELPKFRAKSMTEKKLQVLWLRFLAELNEEIKEVPAEWLDVPEIQEALHLAEEAAYTKEELMEYQSYWDTVSTQITFLDDAKQEGLEEGIEKGREEGLAEGMEKGVLTVAKNMLAKGITITTIAEVTQLPVSEIEQFAKELKKSAKIE